MHIIIGYGRLVAVFYNNNTQVWSTQDNLTIGSAVISIAVVDSEHNTGRRHLAKPFQYTLDHVAASNASCVFWSAKDIPRLAVCANFLWDHK